MPGKTDASLNEKLTSVEWGNFKLYDLFDKIKTNLLKYKTCELPNTKTDECCLPALTAGIKNQGLNNYVPREGATIIKKAITISANGTNTGATFYQPNEFTVLQDAYALKWLFADNNLSDNQYLFLTGCVSKTTCGNYDWTNKATWNKIKSKQIKLPIKNGKIDFDFMESFIAEIKSQYVTTMKAELLAELKAYLKVSGLPNYELSCEEKYAIDNYNCLEWKEYKIGDLFSVNSSKKIYHANEIEEIFNIRTSDSFPYIVRSTKNNGLRGYIVRNKNNLNDANTLSFAQDTFTVFYQKEKYFTGNKIKILKPLFHKNSESIMKFMVGCFECALRHLSWGIASTVYSISNMKINLPIKNGKIDFDFIEIFISAIQKLVIKDIVFYKDKKINAAKRIINK